MMRMMMNLLCVGILLGTAGCPPRRAVIEPICPGKETIADAVEALEMQRSNLHPIQARVRVVLNWTDPDGKEQKEDFDGQLRFTPPDRLFVRGEKFGEIRFGTNEEAFWLMVKPELDSYWWGTRQAADMCQERLQFNPWNVTEALGMAEVDATWDLRHIDGFDVLTKSDNLGRPIKRVRVRACDYLVSTIEVLNPDADQSALISLDEYTASEQGLMVPGVIGAEHMQGGQRDAAMRVELRGIRRFEMEPAKLERLYARPSKAHYENVYRLSSDCEFVLVGQ